ncbi:hypothetical protein [Raoultella terrigena]|uniref:hypothetical protein n=1 Tax=Raoultella terrigena TaxID=577 RepID=UPI00384B773D
MTLKRKIAMVCIALFAGLLMVVAHVIPVRPVVTIVNNTKEYIFVYAGESIYDVEPEPDEVDKIVRSKPEIISPGKKIDVTVSLLSLIRRGAAIDIGWRLGGPYDYNSIGGGGRNFILSSSEGVCSVSIKIQGVLDNTLENTSGGLCLKKIKPFKYKY